MLTTAAYSSKVSKPGHSYTKSALIALDFSFTSRIKRSADLLCNEGVVYPIAIPGNFPLHALKQGSLSKINFFTLCPYDSMLCLIICRAEIMLSTCLVFIPTANPNALISSLPIRSCVLPPSVGSFASNKSK